MLIVAGEKEICPICGELMYHDDSFDYSYGSDNGTCKIINQSCKNCDPIPESNDAINADNFKLIYKNGFLRVFEAKDYTFICDQDKVLAWVDSGMEFIDLIKKLDNLDILNIGN